MLALELGSGVASEEIFELEQFGTGGAQPLIGDEAFKQYASSSSRRTSRSA